MRINLQCPYEEKDQAKAIGARWDPAKRTWYVVDPTDLAPFLRWMPGVKWTTLGPGESGKLPDSQRQKKKKRRKERHQPVRIEPFRQSVARTVHRLPSCQCDALPWDDCEHTANAGIDQDQIAHLRSI